MSRERHLPPVGGECPSTDRHPNAPARAAQPSGARSPGGYNLVILMVAVTVMNIAVAAALPLWSTQAKREREAELVFRGLQYAEGIRVFQQRFGRPPLRLEELVEVEPRSMRQLWRDPMTGSLDWGVVTPFGAPGLRPPQGGEPTASPEGRLPPGDPGDAIGVPGDPSRGPQRGAFIMGVYSRSTEEGLRTFFGQKRYDQWRFTVALVTPGGPPPGQPGGPPGAPGQPGASPPRPGFGVPGQQGQPGQPGGAPNMTRLEWIGRPFPPGVELQGQDPLPGQMPGAPSQGGPQRPQRSKRPGGRG